MLRKPRPKTPVHMLGWKQAPLSCARRGKSMLRSVKDCVWQMNGSGQCPVNGVARQKEILPYRRPQQLGKRIGRFT